MEQNTLNTDTPLVPLTNWKKPPTLLELKQDLADARPIQNSQVTKVETWLDNLNGTGKAKVKTPEGNSKIVPKLIRKQAEWRYAALSEPFLSTDDLFNVSPISWEDTQAARQNQVLLNNQINTKLDKVTFIDEYVRTAVDEGTVIVQTGWRFEEEQYVAEEPIVQFVVNPEYGPMHEQLAQMLAESPSQYATDVPEELKQAHELTKEQGIPIQPVIQGKQKVTKTRIVSNHPTAEICDIRNVVFDPTCLGNYELARFAIKTFESSLAELKAANKYKNLERINIAGNSILGTPDHAVPTEVQSFNFKDEPRKKFVVHEYWGFRDIDGSGKVVPIVAAWVGDQLIRLEENPYPDKSLPFVVVQYLPVRKSIYGEPDGALLEDNQQVIGAVTRGMIDIMAKSANGQTGVRKDMLDATNRRKFDKGMDYEFNANVDPRQGVYMHSYPEIPASAQFMLQLQNMEAESLTGVKSFSSGVSGASLGDVAAGVRGALDAASKRELGILRRLSAGICKMGRKFISMNAELLSEEEVVRVTNEQFVTVRRDDLPGNFDLKLSISTAEEDNNKAQELAFMLQTAGPNMDPSMSRMILSEIARLRKMPDLAKRIEQYQPQPDPMAQQMQQLEMLHLQAKIAKENAMAQHYASMPSLQEAKAATEEAKRRNLDSDTDKKNLDFVEQESGVKQERDLQKVGEQARCQVVLKQMGREINRENRNFDLVREYAKAK